MLLHSWLEDETLAEHRPNLIGRPPQIVLLGLIVFETVPKRFLPLFFSFITFVLLVLNFFQLTLNSLKRKNIGHPILFRRDGATLDIWHAALRGTFKVYIPFWYLLLDRRILLFFCLLMRLW
jgi:hypothetical protein